MIRNIQYLRASCDGKNETEQILKTMPNILHDIKKGKSEFKNGNTHALDKVLYSHGLSRLAKDYLKIVARRDNK